MFTHVTLVNLPVRDQQRSVDFFVDKLGFEKRTDADYGPGARWIEVAPPGSRTGVVLMPSDDEAAFAADPVGVLFGCDDASATAARLRAAGVEVTDPATEHWGTFILVTEPDGRKICVTENGSGTKDD